jgi:endonuclease YncB( thermonuclease family)
LDLWTFISDFGRNVDTQKANYRKTDKMKKSIAKYLNPFRWFYKKRDKEMEMAVYEEVQPFIPDITRGKVIRLHDGEIITIATRIQIEGNLTMKLRRVDVRLRGIDSPKIRTKIPSAKILAIDAREALHKLIMGNVVFLQGVRYDKYERILADV